MAETHESPLEYCHAAPPLLIQAHGLLFPMILVPPSDNPNYTLESLLHIIGSHTEWVECQLKQVGALLFRGFPLKTASDFNAMMEAFGWEEQPYKGPATRTRVEGRVYTANEAPLHQPINFHHEMSIFEDFPTKIAFFCEVAPPEGGETAIALSHKITDRMTDKYPELLSKLKKEGLFYSARFSQEDDPNSFITGWRTYFRANNKEEAQIKAAESEFKWKVRWEGSTMICETGPLVSITTFDGNKGKS